MMNLPRIWAKPGGGLYLGLPGDSSAGFQQSYPQNMWKVQKSVDKSARYKNIQCFTLTPMDRHEEWIVRVALDQPTPTLFEYRYATAHKPQAGQLAHKPFGMYALLCRRNGARYCSSPLTITSADWVRSPCPPFRARCAIRVAGRV